MPSALDHGAAAGAFLRCCVGHGLERVWLIENEETVSCQRLMGMKRLPCYLPFLFHFSIDWE